MLGGIIAAAVSAIGSQIKAIEARNAEDRAYTKQKELMQDQYSYNNKMAEENQRRAKEMWNYTNFENQKQHLLNANLSPGLFYGGGGAGGASTSGGQGQGIGLGSETGVGYGIQEKALGLQLASIASQIALNESQANKNNAEAKKIAGADTKVAEKEAEMLESQSEFNKRITKLQDSIEKLTKAQEQKTAAEYFYIQAQEKKVWEEVREQVVKADVAENTKEAMIRKTTLENFNLMQTGIESITRQKLNSEQINYLKGQIAIGWANVAIGEKSVANESDRIANELLMGMRDLDRKERELIKDWIYEGIHAGKEISGEILNWLMRGAPKTIAEVTGRIEEMFDSEGKQIGSKTIQQTVKKIAE